MRRFNSATVKSFFLSLSLILLLGCAPNPGNYPPTETSNPLPVTKLAPALPITKLVATLSTPHIDQPPDVDALTPSFGQCAFQWTYKDLPELTTQMDSAIKTLDPAASAHANAFGEDCMYADGHADFTARETDFYIQKLVTNLTDYESFGNWIVQVITVIESLSSDQIVGPTPGFVEFLFRVNETEQIIVRVLIQQFNEIGKGKTGEELFRLFYTSP